MKAIKYNNEIIEFHVNMRAAKAVFEQTKFNMLNPNTDLEYNDFEVMTVIFKELHKEFCKKNSQVCKYTDEQLEEILNENYLAFEVVFVNLLTDYTTTQQKKMVSQIKILPKSRKK